jgi:hypothetical protein
MALETAFFVVQELLKLNAFVLLGLVFLIAFVAYKVFAFVLRVLITGLAFGAFPIIANFAGIPIPITLQTILWSAITGILIYFVYMGIRFVYRIINIAFYPFRKMFSRKSKEKDKN